MSAGRIDHPVNLTPQVETRSVTAILPVGCAIEHRAPKPDSASTRLPRDLARLTGEMGRGRVGSWFAQRSGREVGSITLGGHGWVPPQGL